MEKINLGVKIPPFPMPVTMVGTISRGKVNFMTASWVNKVNGNPPIWMIAIGKTKHTLDGIREKKAFSINFPSASMIDKTDYCGLVSGRNTDKSKIFDVFYGELESAPMIKDCPLCVEFKLHDLIELPRVFLVLGEVKGVYSEDRYLTEGKLDIQKMDPVVLTMPDNKYWKIGDFVAGAWDAGKKLKQQDSNS